MRERRRAERGRGRRKGEKEKERKRKRDREKEKGKRGKIERTGCLGRQPVTGRRVTEEHSVMALTGRESPDKGTFQKSNDCSWVLTKLSNKGVGKVSTQLSTKMSTKMSAKMFSKLSTKVSAKMSGIDRRPRGSLQKACFP